MTLRHQAALPAVLVALLSLVATTAQASPCETEPTDMSVAYGDQITCPISPGSDTDLFRFAGVAGDRVLAEAVFAGGANFNPRIRIIAPNGTQLGDTWSPALLNLLLPQTGTYTAVVSDDQFQFVGDYSFTVSCISGTCLGTPPPPPYPAPERSTVCEPEPTDMVPYFGTRVECDITPGTDTDLYRFEARAGDRILAEAVWISGANFNPRIQIVAPNGALLGDTWSPALLNLALTQTGTYTAIVFDDQYQFAGHYAFTVSCLGGSCLSLQSVPTISLTLTGCTVCSPGDTMSVQAHVQNLGPARVTEIKLGFRKPDGTSYKVGNKHQEAPIPAGLDVSVPTYSFVWGSGLPPGQWTVEATLLGPDLGDTFNRDVKVFTVP